MIDKYETIQYVNIQYNNNNVIKSDIPSVILLWLFKNNNTITSIFIMATLLSEYHNVFSSVKFSYYYVTVVFLGLGLFCMQHDQFGWLLCSKHKNNRKVKYHEKR